MTSIMTVSIPYQLPQVGVELAEDEGAAIAAELAATEQMQLAGTGTGHRTAAGRLHTQRFLQALDMAAMAWST